MKLTLNGKSQFFDSSPTIQEALEHFGQNEGPFAVALNKEFVPRSQYAMIRLNDGDQLDLVVPMQGG
jgi:sulfur carrier protein